MIQIRRNCFETNSSSTHCLAVPEKNNIDEGAIRGKEIHFGLDYFGRPLEAKEVNRTDYLYTAILNELSYMGWLDNFSEEENRSIRENPKAPDLNKYCPKAMSRLNKLKDILNKYGVKYSFEEPIWAKAHYWGYDKPQYKFKRDVVGDVEDEEFGIDHPEDLDEILDMLLEDENMLINFLFEGIVMIGSDEAEDEERAKIKLDDKTYVKDNWEWDNKKRSYKFISSEVKENPNYKEGYKCFYKGN